METKRTVLIEEILPKIENKKIALVKDVFLVLSFAFLTGISAKLKIEIGLVPITGQTLMVLLSGALLGSKKGALSQLIYLLGGIFGIPWFARGGGMVYLMSPTFGYILGFVLAAYFVGFLCEKGFDRKIKSSILAMLLGNILIYLPGLFWLSKFVGFEKALAIGLYPFIIGDLFKLLLASLILPFGWRLLGKKP